MFCPSWLTLNCYHCIAGAMVYNNLSTLYMQIVLHHFWCGKCSSFLKKGEHTSHRLERRLVLSFVLHCWKHHKCKPVNNAKKCNLRIHVDIFYFDNQIIFWLHLLCRFHKIWWNICISKFLSLLIFIKIKYILPGNGSVVSWLLDKHFQCIYETRHLFNRFSALDIWEYLWLLKCI